jgi:hypothetical protein
MQPILYTAGEHLARSHLTSVLLQVQQPEEAAAQTVMMRRRRRKEAVRPHHQQSMELHWMMMTMMGKPATMKREAAPQRLAAKRNKAGHLPQHKARMRVDGSQSSMRRTE